MRLQFISIAGGAADEAYERLAAFYTGRLDRYIANEVRVFRSETALDDFVEKQRGRTAPAVVLLDSRGNMFSSEKLAAWIGRRRDGGTQTLIFAVGPANGWSDEARKRAGLLLSLGPMTLPHQLARVVLAEQVYRAFTILEGHPYHGGH